MRGMCSRSVAGIHADQGSLRAIHNAISSLPHVREGPSRQEP